MRPKRILVLGAGFAGLWSAAGAARKLDELGVGANEVQVTLVNRDPFHSIRVRNYEADLSPTRAPLRDVLDPIGVACVEGEVRGFDFAGRQAIVATAGGEERLAYDRLVLALGSRVVRPALPGLEEFAFDVDTYQGASRLQAHLHGLVASATSLNPQASGEKSSAPWTALVVGAGLTGIELATGLPGRLRSLLDAGGVADAEVRVILADHSDHIGSTMGPYARPVIAEALASLGVETRVGVRVAAISRDGATLASGEFIPARTVVWCAGLRAAPLTEHFPVERDHWGRLPVDEFMRVKGMEGVFAAGDVAAAMVDLEHASVMSCQHGRPMGRFAGHNVVCDLLGLPMLPLAIDWYVTVLDLGPWGAVYTERWDQHVVAVGAAAKATKRMINCERIYPPRGDRQAILAAAAPVVQRPPSYQA
jgi:NADH:ubiquinone reductase (H+-translocating)